MVGSTQSECGCQHCVCHRIDQSTQPGGSHQGSTDLGTHENWILKRVANGHITNRIFLEQCCLLFSFPIKLCVICHGDFGGGSQLKYNAKYYDPQV